MSGPPPKSKRNGCVVIWAVSVLAILGATLAGCGYSGLSTAVPAVSLQGSVHGGQQPVQGSSIQLYAAGTNGDGSSAHGLLSQAVQTDSNGNFSIPGAYGCPSATSQIFVIAQGGKPGLASGANNSALTLMAALGSCASLSRVGPIVINEVTTVGSVWPLAAYMKSSTEIGSASGDPDFLTAVSNIPEFINVAAGSSPGKPGAASSFTESSKLYSLADLLANCVNSAGGSPGDGSPCGQLFAMATPAGGKAPTDAITAAMTIAQHPNNNVAGIFSLTAADTAFQPALSSAPVDWTLSLTYPVAVPLISLPTGTYNGSQQVTISDATPNSTIYYTTDGTVPTSAASVYQAPVEISVSTTLQAIAFLENSQSDVAASTLTIAAPPPAQKLVFLQQPTNAVTGATITPGVTIAVEDGNGNLLTTATNPITLTLTTGSGLTGTLAATPQNGVATFSNLSLVNAGNYSLTATSPGLVSAASATFTISAPNTGKDTTATKLAFLQQPSNSVAGATMSPVLVVVEDSSGNTVTSATSMVTLALAAGSGSGLGGTLTVAAQNGIATFSALTVSAAGTYTLQATSAGLTSASSATFTISAPNTGKNTTAAKLAFLQQPSNAVAGATMSPVLVAVEDSNGNTVTSATNMVTLALAAGTGLGGTLTVAAQNGIATFNTLTVSAPGTYTLVASSTSLTSADSSSFTIAAPVLPPSPAKLAFVQQPSNALTGATISPAVTVAVQDSNGNTVTSATNMVTLALASGSGPGGTLTVAAQNGIATFNTLTVSTAGTYTLVATSTSLTSAQSNSFTIAAPVIPPPPAKLAFVQQPSNALTGATISPAVTVAVQDSNGNTVTSATNMVTLALASGSGLGGTLTVAAQNGIATFNTLTVSTAGTDTLVASSTSLASADSSSFTIAAPVLPPSPAKLAILQQPSNALTGATISPAVTVAVQDSNGNTVTSATNMITLALSSGSGLAGTVNANPHNGIATFSSLSVNAAGTYTLAASSTGLTTATSAAFTITVPPPPSSGATYYISPTGSDANSGLSTASPWLTPNHSLLCGDVISAASGSYSSANFNTGKWGTVSCPAGNNVAWLQCATFDTCRIATTTSDGMWVDQSYWGVQGWEISASNSTDGACFHAGPRSSSVHHIIFANDVANGCMGGGFTAYDRSTSASVDYIVYVGNIAYNSAQGSGACFSGFNIYQPIASDNNAGTHMFVAGNFSWNNTDGDPCAGTAPTDGEGINFDTWDFSQGGGAPYTQQGVIENNIEFLNGGDGIEVENNSAGGDNASIYIKNNTQYGDRRDTHQTFCTGNGEIDLYKASNVSATGNLIYTGFATGCQGDAMYAIAVSTSDATNVIDSNFASGVDGNDTFLFSSGSLTMGLANIFGTNPLFAQPSNPLAPSCSGAANVAACMAAVVADFTPTVSAAKAYGYQSPTSNNLYDPLFPQWLCHAALPAGLVTMGCQ